MIYTSNYFIFEHANREVKEMSTVKERELIEHVKNKTSIHNVDNISRTKAYQNFYFSFPEIHWAFLASMVSRNAGWNMTDLSIDPFYSMLSQQEKKDLFSTYERANWLIFSDAYPQLLIYAYSCETRKPLFDCLSFFHVSSFMIEEWWKFWEEKDYTRLVYALIINEQNIIQKPVIEQSYYKHEVFHKLPFQCQDLLYLSAVMFPTLKGELFGAYAHGFSNLTKRIKLGKKLYATLFHQDLYRGFHAFARYTEPTGTRFEYERYFTTRLPKAPMLRSLYPVITHQDKIRNDWYVSGRSFKKKWWKQEYPDLSKDVSNRFYAKRFLLQAWDRMKKTSLFKK